MLGVYPDGLGCEGFHGSSQAMVSLSAFEEKTSLVDQQLPAVANTRSRRHGDIGSRCLDPATIKAQFKKARNALDIFSVHRYKGKFFSFRSRVVSSTGSEILCTVDDLTDRDRACFDRIWNLCIQKNKHVA